MKQVKQGQHMKIIENGNYRKIIILDTSVLIHDPECLNKFKDAAVILPFVCLEEIDNIKERKDDVSYNARQCARILDALTVQWDLENAISLNENGGKLLFAHHDNQFCRKNFPEQKNDNKIISIAFEIFEHENKKEINERAEVLLISKDTNLRLKARALGIHAEDYKSDKVSNYDFLGYRELQVSQSIIDKLYSDKALELTELEYLFSGKNPHPNEFFVLKYGESQSALFIYKENKFFPVKDSIISRAIKPKNLEQKLAMHLLLDPSVNLLTISGPAGGGKTLMSLLAGVHQTIDHKKYRQLLITKSTISLPGHDLGFLPGTAEEKVNPYFKSFHDNLDVIFENEKIDTNFSSDKNFLSLRPAWQAYFYSQRINISPLAFLRGQTLPSRFIIVDEAQNLSPHDVKTIITRAGEGSKIVLLGDIDQIDNRYLDRSSNGLSYIVEKFKEQSIAGHITLLKTERSKLAEIAAKIL